MSEARIDNNRTKTLLGVSNADETTPVAILADPTTGRLLVNSNLSSISGTTVSEYAEDDPHTSGDKGVMTLAVRQDVQADFGANGDYVPLSINADGELRVTAGSLSGTTVSEYAEDATHTSGDLGVMSLAVRNDTLAALATTDGDYAPLQVNANGALFAEISSALPTGSNEIGVVVANLGATDNAVLDGINAKLTLQDGIATSLAALDNAVSGNELQVDVVTMPTTTVQATNLDVRDLTSVSDSVAVLQATASNLNAQIVGNIAHDTGVSGNPVQLAGEARSSDRTAVANADVARLVTDLGGKLITSPYSNPENFLRGTAATTAAGGSNVLIAAQGAGTRIYLTSLIISNASATDTEVVITEAGGTELATFPAPQAGGAVHAFPTPLKVPDVNTALTYELVGAATTVTVTAVAYRGV